MHLDDLHSPGPGPNHVGWSSFKDEDENAETLQATDCQFYQSLSQPGALTSEEKARPETQDVSECVHRRRPLELSDLISGVTSACDVLALAAGWVSACSCVCLWLIWSEGHPQIDMARF